MDSTSYAVQCHDLQLVKFLLQNGSDVNARTDRKIMPLHVQLGMDISKLWWCASERCGHKWMIIGV